MSTLPSTTAAPGRPDGRISGRPALLAAFPVFLAGAVLAGAGTAEQQGLRDAARGGTDP